MLVQGFRLNPQIHRFSCGSSSTECSSSTPTYGPRRLTQGHLPAAVVRMTRITQQHMAKLPFSHSGALFVSLWFYSIFRRSNVRAEMWPPKLPSLLSTSRFCPQLLIARRARGSSSHKPFLFRLSAPGLLVV